MLGGFERPPLAAVGARARGADGGDQQRDAAGRREMLRSARDCALCTVHRAPRASAGPRGLADGLGRAQPKGRVTSQQALARPGPGGAARPEAPPARLRVPPSHPSNRGLRRRR